MCFVDKPKAIEVVRRKMVSIKESVDDEGEEGSLERQKKADGDWSVFLVEKQDA